ncbi:DUF402 domain-containing protein [Pseudarthrobacter sp. SL88]|uniref:DUF402 domain-containing protein n=1 Tax=Pseudarthrobacter sp. SL88 TaxID=2994666 RepID=UPI002273C295|nr:DUF402 domain-containing protein [Pseudarthrobacter sp. SL88]MCY1675066.1 DUF402 domain-containing protein [Pseudarthrobacter sp. SL88]
MRVHCRGSNTPPPAAFPSCEAGRQAEGPTRARVSRHDAHPGGVRTYIDLAVGHEWNPIRPHVTEFHVIDMDLDVVSTAGRGVFIDDEDEFEDHRAAMNYPAALAESLEASAAELFQAVKAQQAPFDGTDVGWFTKGRI